MNNFLNKIHDLASSIEERTNDLCKQLAGVVETSDIEDELYSLNDPYVFTIGRERVLLRRLTTDDGGNVVLICSADDPDEAYSSETWNVKLDNLHYTEKLELLLVVESILKTIKK